MNKHLGVIAFALGLAAVAWVAHGYLGANPLAMSMSLLIAACYLMGALELRRFGHATAALQVALATLAARPAPLARLGNWLATLPASLQDPVRLRIEGERVALPGPAMTPYLVGLLVLLGMLGTFLGMVVTLNGTVAALQSSSDLPTMRGALAAPILGLGLAFGTSVAGLATSAMLGLMSALSRRDRLQAAQALEAHIATDLRPFSRAFQREDALHSAQTQAALLPELLQALQALMAQQTQHAELLGQRLLAGQDTFHQQARQTHTALAGAVDRSLQHSLAAAGRAAGAALQPAVAASMAGITRETAVFQQGLASSLQQQLDGLADRLDGAIDALVASSSAMLGAAGTQFQQRLDAEASRLSSAAEQLGANAIEVASLGEAFGVAVQSFGSASEALVGQLQRVEGALAKSSARSDEQLAYYVAQAREIVFLSISSQRLIVEDLQRLAIRQPPLANHPLPPAGAEA